MIDTEAVWQHDVCERLRTWSAQYELPRIPLVEAMYTALRAGLLAGDGKVAKDALIAIAAQPGLDIEAWNVFDIAMHHASLMEVVVAYLTADGPWAIADPVDGFSPQSFQMEDGRLRRVVLCSSWNTLREAEERQSWRTIADVTATNRPMLINAIVIGNSIKGFRPSPWTRGYIHPENGILRVKKKEGNFTEKWKRVYREQTDEHADDWLRLMQQDGAFEDLVFSVTADRPGNEKTVRKDMFRIINEIGRNGTEMRRSGCYRFGPCSFARICHSQEIQTPIEAGWEEKSTEGGQFAGQENGAMVSFGKK